MAMPFHDRERRSALRVLVTLSLRLCEDTEHIGEVFDALRLEAAEVASQARTDQPLQVTELLIRLGQAKEAARRLSEQVAGLESQAELLRVTLPGQPPEED